MLLHFGVETLVPEWRDAVVGVGTFDGVHLGHQAVLARLIARAAEEELPAVLVTFDRHPAHILAPGKVPPALATLGGNLREFERLGVPAVVVLPFNAWLSRLSATQFLDELLVVRMRARSLVVGHDFAFGSGREGDVEWLRARIPTEVVPPFELDGTRVSSSRIRAAIAEGDLPTANRLLGRPFALEGVVVGGKRLGRTIGYPTLNLARSAEGVMPPHGVYASRAHTPYGIFPAALSIGVRPAVETNGARSIEAYLMEYPGETLYGREVRLELHARLRGEESFPSLDALTAQIARDVDAVRGLVPVSISSGVEKA